MGDIQSPYMPPSPSIQHPKSNLPILYYGLAVVGAAAVILTVYNLLIIKWYTNHQGARRSNQFQSFQNQNRNRNRNRNVVVSSFKYKKDMLEAEEVYECAVCLSALEEGEDVTQLPICKHSFHTLCIDMWLYSHSDCPLCRVPVWNATPEHSRERLLEAGVLS